MKLVKDDSVDIEAVFGIGLCRQHLIKAVGRGEKDTLLGSQYLAPLVEGRTHADHICGNVEDDCGLASVCGTAVNLSSLLTITTTKQKSDCRSKLALSILLGNLYICSVELPVSVGLHDAKQISYNLFLPVQKLERFPGPGAFCVAELLDEHDCIVRSILIVVGILQHKSGRLIFS